MTHFSKAPSNQLFLIGAGLLIAALIYFEVFYLNEPDRSHCCTVSRIFPYLRRQGKSKDDIFRAFGLDPAAYELISSDLGKGHARKKRIRWRGVGGEPDAIFRHKVAVGSSSASSYRRWGCACPAEGVFSDRALHRYRPGRIHLQQCAWESSFSTIQILEIEHHPELFSNLIQLRS